MHQNKNPSLCSSGTYKWTSLFECHHTKCATERTPQVPVSEGTITGRKDGWKGRELQLLLWAACSSCCPCHASSRWPDSQDSVGASAAATLAAVRTTQRVSAQSSAWSPAPSTYTRCLSPRGAGDCSKFCLSSICNATETGTTDAGAAAACVDDCTVNWNSYKNKHT